MTVSYSGDVGNACGFGCFNKILIRWKGSVYKLVYKELLAYISLYLVINLTYRLILVRKRVDNTFHIMKMFCENSSNQSEN